jgi:hypothetical protein
MQQLLPSYCLISHHDFLPLCLQVKLGLEEVATDLFRVKPYVYSSPSNSAVIVFSGTDQKQPVDHVVSSLQGRGACTQWCQLMCCSDTKQGVCKTTVNSWQWHAWHTS